MKSKKLLAIILLSLSFCFVSGAGYGEIPEWLTDIESSLNMKVWLVNAKVDYVMNNPESFLFVTILYDSRGDLWGESSLRGIRTKNKIVGNIKDTRGIFSYKSGRFLLRQFEKELEALYWGTALELIATNMDTDIVIRFLSEDGVPLGYFYQGEYHLWEKAVSKEAIRTDESAKETERVPVPSESRGQIYTGPTKGHWVSEKIDGGRIIKLEDGSLWEISPLDRIETMLWLVVQNISIIKRDDLFYPYYLLNKSTGDMVEAKLISS